MRRNIVALFAGATLLLAGCSSSTPEDSSSDSDAPSEGAYPTTIVLADQQPVDQFNPVAGYGELGTSPLYDGLLVPAPATASGIPELQPALAAEPPVANEDATEWTVKIREDVTFSNGEPLTAKDVANTYMAILNPDTASPAAAGYSMIEEVAAEDDYTVKFKLKHPYADLPSRMLVGIAPSSAIEEGPVTEWKLNTEPIGTGAYVMESLQPDEVTFTARTDGWHPTPEVSKLTIVSVPDDTARAQRLTSGQIMGAQLTPSIAVTFDGKQGFEIASNKTVDWRGLTLPVDNPFTGDPKVRLALNYAVDREALVKDVLLGYGEVGYTPVNEAYGDIAPENAFTYDPDKAAELIKEAGWEKGDDGLLKKDGEVAHLDLWHPAGDQLRKDLTFAVAENLKDLGVEVTIDSSDWDAVEEKLPHVASMFGGGDQPYSVDTQLWGPLHSRMENTDVYDNPTGSSVPGLDEVLEKARETVDPAEREALYREAMDLYLENPSYLILVFLHHTYVEQSNDWQGKEPVLEPHAHGVSWGPWWNIAEWHK